MNSPLLLALAALLAASASMHAQNLESGFGDGAVPPVPIVIPEEAATDADGPTADTTAPAETPPAEPLTETPDPSLPAITLGAPANPTDSEPGLAVRVEKIPAAHTAGPAKEVTLASPFPPKPLNAIPAGWTLRRPDDTKPYQQVVDLGGGNLVTLSIVPFVLTPDDRQPDAKVFSIREPGHKPALQYRQIDTVGALLTTSTRQLDHTDSRMTEAISRLNQLLLSFPKEPQ